MHWYIILLTFYFILFPADYLDLKMGKHHFTKIFLIFLTFAVHIAMLGVSYLAVFPEKSQGNNILMSLNCYVNTKPSLM